MGNLKPCAILLKAVKIGKKKLWRIACNSPNSPKVFYRQYFLPYGTLHCVVHYYAIQCLVDMQYAINANF